MSIEVSPNNDPANIVDKAASAADGAIRAAQAATNVAFDGLANGLDQARQTASPKLDELSSATEEVLREGLENVKARSAELRNKATNLSNTASERIREEPLKFVLLAAATGLIVGWWLNRPDYRAY